MTIHATISAALLRLARAINPPWVVSVKPSRQAVHSVAVHIVISTIARTVKTCPQRILVADMIASITIDSEEFGRLERRIQEAAEGSRGTG